MLFRRSKDKRQRGPISTRLVRIKLPTDVLELGMHIVELDRPWTEVPVMFQNFLVEKNRQLEILRQYCTWVMVEVEQQFVSANRDFLRSLENRTYQALPERHQHREGTAPGQAQLRVCRQLYRRLSCTTSKTTMPCIWKMPSRLSRTVSPASWPMPMPCSG